jgi:hypothetical protein
VWSILNGASGGDGRRVAERDMHVWILDLFEEGFDDCVFGLDDGLLFMKLLKQKFLFTEGEIR